MKNARDIVRTRDSELTAFTERLDSDMQSLRRLSVFSHALEIDIFSYLNEPKTIPTLSEEMGYDSVILELFLKALSQMGIINLVSEGYIISQFARKYLIQNSILNQTTHFSNLMVKVKDWQNLEYVLQNGPVERERTSQFNQNWMEGIAQSSMDGQIGEFIQLCAEHINLKTCRRLLDLGGGHGLYSIAFSALYPDMECTVFDLPSIANFTEIYIKDYDSSVNVISGDYFLDEIPTNQDIILSSFSRCGSDPAIIGKIRDSLVEHGYLVIRRHRAMVSEDALENLEWNLVSTTGRRKGAKKWEFGTSPAVEEYLQNLKANGFSIVYHQIFDPISEVLIARKEGAQNES